MSLGLDWLPAANAAMILASAACLLVGRRLIRAGRVAAHRRAMLAATGLAAAFLVTYVARWAFLGTHRFEGVGWTRTLYFSLLIGHSILAVVVIPFVLQALRHGRAGRYTQHRRWARVAYPLWLVAAVSGWVVWWLLYHGPRA